MITLSTREHQVTYQTHLKEEIQRSKKSDLPPPYIIYYLRNL